MSATSRSRYDQRLLRGQRDECFADPIPHGLVAVGKFDGVQTSIAYATVGGKVCIHSPHAFGELPRVQYLNITKDVTALTAGVLDPGLRRDVLIIGTSTSLQAYDVYANQDLFYKNTPDGVSKLAIGQLGWKDGPLVIVGGNCSVFACDHVGREHYWTVTGDTVCSVSLCNINARGQRGLLLGSANHIMKILYDDQVVAEIAEADQVTELTALSGTKFGYALANGTVGVYDLSVRRWRVKSKHSVTAIASHTVDGDQPGLITAWSNGRVSVYILVQLVQLVITIVSLYPGQHCLMSLTISWMIQSAADRGQTGRHWTDSIQRQHGRKYSCNGGRRLQGWGHRSNYCLCTDWRGSFPVPSCLNCSTGCSLAESAATGQHHGCTRFRPLPCNHVGVLSL